MFVRLHNSIKYKKPCRKEDKMKKNKIGILMAACMGMSLLGACGNLKNEVESTVIQTSVISQTSEQTTENTDTSKKLETEGQEAEKTQEILLEYPQIMQEKGYTEPLILKQMPEKVVVMSSAPVLALYRLGINMIAVPKSTVVTWPEDLAAKAEELNIVMNSNFDIETVVAMEPDLVILGYTNADTYGKILEEVDIPVYYVDAGHTVSYESIKQQTEILVKAFGADLQAGKDILQAFTDLESRLENAKQKYEGKTVMVLQSAPPNHYIQTKDGTLGSMMNMLGFSNVYENSASSMVEIDLEVALSYDPELILCVGSSKTAQEHQKLMEEEFTNNPAYWNSIPAIERGDIIYLPNSYVSSAGINIIDNINQLIEIIEAHYEQ